MKQVNKKQHSMNIYCNASWKNIYHCDKICRWRFYQSFCLRRECNHTVIMFLLAIRKTHDFVFCTNIMRLEMQKC